MRRRALLGFCLMMVICMAVVGCGKTPDRMTKPEFEAWLTVELGFSEISLTEERPGYFTGIGKNDGETFHLTVTRKHREVTWEATPYYGDEVLSGSLSW